MDPVTINYILAACLAIAVGYGVGSWAFKKDTEVEQRRLAAAELSGILREQGLVHIPGFLTKYSVGDYSGMVEDIKTAVKLFNSGPGVVLKEFETVYGRILDAKLKDPKAVEELRARLNEVE